MNKIDYSTTGKINAYYLKKTWHYYQLQRNNADITEEDIVDWKYVNALFNLLGIGTEPTIKVLLTEGPTFEQFEDWILSQGQPSEELIKQFNAAVEGKKIDKDSTEDIEPVLSAKDLEHWNEKGYVIVRNAVSKEDCAAAEELVYKSIGAEPNIPDTWYRKHPIKSGIMIQLFQHEILNRIRLSPRIKSAYQQLWNRNDLLVSMDRVSFNPPETKTFKFPGPHIHWDVSLKQPIPFGLQGLLYLSDTAENQGAFTIIPGFHNVIEDWLNKLPTDVNPRDPELLQQFEHKAIGANAGDFIIWDHRLPHGSSPNTSDVPRMVQYINYQPIELEYHPEWI